MAAVARKTNSTAHPCSSCSHAMDAMVAMSRDRLSAAASSPERRRTRETAARTAATDAETRRMRYPVCGGIEPLGPPRSSAWSCPVNRPMAATASVTRLVCARRARARSPGSARATRRAAIATRPGIANRPTTPSDRYCVPRRVPRPASVTSAPAYVMTSVAVIEPSAPFPPPGGEGTSRPAVASNLAIASAWRASIRPADCQRAS